MLPKISKRILFKFLAGYTLAFGIFQIVPIITLIKLYQVINWEMVAIPLLLHIPVIVFAMMVLVGIKSAAFRKAVLVLAGYTFLLFTFFLFFTLIPPIEWARIVISLLYLPVLVLSGLVLVALKRGTTPYL